MFLKYSPDGNSCIKLRVGLQCLANVFSLTGLCLILAAMLTSGWQISLYAGKKGTIFEHGLYRDCVQGQEYIKPFEDWVCFWKFDQNNHIETDRFFKLRDYQVSVLVIFGSSCIFALFTVICACYTICTRICNIPWAVCALVTAVSAVVGIGVFGFNASISENRFIRMDNYEVDMIWGYSFYIAVGGVVCHFLAMMLAGLCVALAFTERRLFSGEVPKSVTIPKQTIMSSGTIPNYALNVKTAPSDNVKNGGAKSNYAMPVTSLVTIPKQTVTNAGTVPNYALNAKPLPSDKAANDRITPNYATPATRSIGTSNQATTYPGTIPNYALNVKTLPRDTVTKGTTAPNYATSATRSIATSNQNVTNAGTVSNYALNVKTLPSDTVMNGKTTHNYALPATSPVTVFKLNNTNSGTMSNYDLNVSTVSRVMNSRTLTIMSTPNLAHQSIPGRQTKV